MFTLAALQSALEFAIKWITENRESSSKNSKEYLEKVIIPTYDKFIVAHVKYVDMFNALGKAVTYNDYGEMIVDQLVIESFYQQRISHETSRNFFRNEALSGAILSIDQASKRFFLSIHLYFAMDEDNMSKCTDKDLDKMIEDLKYNSENGGRTDPERWIDTPSTRLADKIKKSTSAPEVISSMNDAVSGLLRRSHVVIHNYVAVRESIVGI
jgi:hypothetical protein